MRQRLWQNEPRDGPIARDEGCEKMKIKGVEYRQYVRIADP
jgi:hypothetical protein